MATKQAAKGGGGASGGGGEQKKAAATPQQEGKEKEPAKAGMKEEKTTPKPGGKDPPKDNKDPAKKPARDDKKEPGGGGGRGNRPEDHRGRDRSRRSSRDHPDHRGRDKEDREVCRNFLHQRCDRGNLCKYYHPRSSSRPRHGPDDPEHRRSSPMRGGGGGGGGGSGSGSGQIVCRDFIRNMCSRGTECRFYHPPSDTSGKKQQGSWLTFCHDFRNGHCLRSDCRFFHITRDDEESYRATGEIPLHVVDQAVRKAMVLDAALTGTRPTCKEFLRGLCNMQNCRFRHLNRREYENEVFHALQEEFENLLGPPDRRPASPPLAGPYPPTMGFHEPPRKYGASPAGFREEMMPPEDLRGPMMPMSEYESEPKRPRYFSGDGIFAPEEFRDGREGMRKWDERMDYELVERGEATPQDAYRLLQEVYTLRNENGELRRNTEREITELKEEVRRMVEENAGLRHEVAKVRSQAAEEAMAQEAALDKLTLANNTLLEDLRKAEEATRRIELEGREKLKALDTKQKNNSVELERKIDVLQKDAAQMREALAKATGAQKKAEDEKAKLLAELDDMRAKMHSGAPPSLRKDHHLYPQQQQQQQQHSGGGSYNTKNSYPRDMMERGSEGGIGGYADMLHGERRGIDTRDQDMRGPNMRGSDRYSPEDPWRNVDKNGRTQYSGSGTSPGYTRRGETSERSRGWHGSAPPQDAWSKGSGGSLMGEYQGDERMRGPAQSSLLRGSAYTAPSGNTGAGLLNLPVDAGDYTKAPPRNPQNSQMGMEGQYMAGQSVMHFEERDYSLSGYDTDARSTQYSSGSNSHQQHSSAGWQQLGNDGGRGRGMGQGWRRGKPF